MVGEDDWGLGDAVVANQNHLGGVSRGTMAVDVSHSLDAHVQKMFPQRTGGVEKGGREEGGEGGREGGRRREEGREGGGREGGRREGGRGRKVLTIGFSLGVSSVQM